MSGPQFDRAVVREQINNLPVTQHLMSNIGTIIQSTIDGDCASLDACAMITFVSSIPGHMGKTLVERDIALIGQWLFDHPKINSQVTEYVREHGNVGRVD